MITTLTLISNNANLTADTAVVKLQNAGVAKSIHIASIERTSGNGTPGSVDTYTITYSDFNRSTFQVTNGLGIDNIIDDTTPSTTFTYSSSKLNSLLEAANIKAIYESNIDTNAFTDALLSKLNSIEANAKDDQLAVDVPYTNTTSGLTATNVQSAVDEVDNRLDTAEAKLSTIESNAKDDQSAVEVPYDNLTSGLAATNAQAAIDEVEGRLSTVETTTSTVGTISTKLDTIETNAKDDQIASEVPFTPTGNIIATNVQAAITEVDTEKQAISAKGQPNGYASLDGAGLVPASQLPSYVDDVIEVATYASLPVTGEASKIYIVVSDETSGGSTTTYRWASTVYVLISNTLSATDVKSLYESNADTNAFTDALLTKLNSIEAGATGTQTASELLTAIKTVDGDSSGLDADMLDGQHASAFALSGHDHAGAYLPLSGGTVTGGLTSDTISYTRSTLLAPDTNLNTVDGITYPSGFYDVSVSNAVTANTPTTGWFYVYVQRHSNNTGYCMQRITTLNEVSNLPTSWIRIQTAGVWGAWHKDWNGSNDGSGSGLDADLLDGNEASAFSLSGHTHNYLPLTGGTITGITSYTNVTDATSTTTGAIKTSGGIGVVKSIYAGGNITAYSDARLKSNIRRIDNALEKVDQLNGYTYDRIDLDLRQTGVIAQEVLNVLPEAVTGSDEEYYGVNYGSMVGILIEAIKELKEEVTALKALHG